MKALIILGDLSLEMKLLMLEDATILPMTNSLKLYTNYLKVSNKCISAFAAYLSFSTS